MAWTHVVLRFAPHTWHEWFMGAEWREINWKSGQFAPSADAVEQISRLYSNPLTRIYSSRSYTNRNDIDKSILTAWNKAIRNCFVFPGLSILFYFGPLIAFLLTRFSKATHQFRLNLMTVHSGATWNVCCVLHDALYSSCVCDVCSYCNKICIIIIIIVQTMRVCRMTRHWSCTSTRYNIHIFVLFRCCCLHALKSTRIVFEAMKGFTPLHCGVAAVFTGHSMRGVAHEQTTMKKI